MSTSKNMLSKENDQKGTVNCPVCKTKQDLLETYGAIAFEKQKKLIDYIGELSWEIDINTGEIYFEDKYVLPIQIIGTFSYSSETWLWAWANSGSNIPEDLLEQALSLKKYGEENEIDLLWDEQFDAGKDDMHFIGMIASGMFDTNGYYLADYGQGIMCVTIKSEVIDKPSDDNTLSILTSFPEFIASYEVNHKNALTNYLTLKGYQLESDNQKLTGTKGNKTITAEFDELSRLKELKG